GSLAEVLAETVRWLRLAREDPEAFAARVAALLADPDAFSPTEVAAAYVALAVLARERGDAEAAAAAERLGAHLLATDPETYLEAQVVLAAIEALLGREEEAEAVLEEALSRLTAANKGDKKDLLKAIKKLFEPEARAQLAAIAAVLDAADNVEAALARLEKWAERLEKELEHHHHHH
uniref:De novo design protein n=1 Tax=synthetic construct TaxID=32630 RepID=UPI0034C6DF12